MRAQETTKACRNFIRTLKVIVRARVVRRAKKCIEHWRDYSPSSQYLPVVPAKRQQATFRRSIPKTKTLLSALSRLRNALEKEGDDAALLKLRRLEKKPWVRNRYTGEWKLESFVEDLLSQSEVEPRRTKARSAMLTERQCWPKGADDEYPLSDYARFLKPVLSSIGKNVAERTIKDWSQQYGWTKNTTRPDYRAVCVNRVIVFKTLREKKYLRPHNSARSS